MTDKPAALATYIAERDEMLLKLNVVAYLAFAEKWNLSRPASREIAEITLHKARTGCRNLPYSERKLSANWLSSRGYSSWDDGELIGS